MRSIASLLLIALLVVSGCGDSGGGGGGGTNGTPEVQTPWSLECTIDTTVLEIGIDVTYALDQAYAQGGSSNLTYGAVVTLEEPTAVALIDAGVTKIDIISMNVATWVVGATPDTIDTLLSSAPINDLDLEVDPDDNGIPGPHRLPLDDVTVASTVMDGATTVELGLSLDQLSMVLGDFEVPTECESPTLVGFSGAFPVDP